MKYEMLVFSEKFSYVLNLHKAAYVLQNKFETSNWLPKNQRINKCVLSNFFEFVSGITARIYLFKVRLQSKSMDWFLYDRDLRRERVKLTYFPGNSLTRILSITNQYFNKLWVNKIISNIQIDVRIDFKTLNRYHTVFWCFH